MNANHDPLTPHRPKLLGLAYRMLGSRSDAEDVVQDAYVRFRTVQDVSNAEALLVTIVSRLCLDRLKRARAKREIYVGPWLPEPVLDPDTLSPHAATELADDLSFALMLSLERLSPSERAAFILHDIFDAPFSEVATTLSKSEAACRQLAARARKAVRSDRRTPASAETHMRLLAAFGHAVQTGDVAALAALLREDAVAISDGGGEKLSARNPIYGPDKIARFFIGAARKFGSSYDPGICVEFVSINGAPSYLFSLNGALLQTISIVAEGEQIVAIYIIRNAQKLAGIRRPT